ncbi:MAG: alkaline phosphatase family protein [Planctomycetaceae bacterium]|nr:alkaline phosphatase family protein [Planctomycetaceae bacterium]
MLKLFILGIDGLPRWMWRRFADSGVMPNSKALLDSGTLVPMKSAMPEVSSAAWASIVTGENSGGHNVYGFTDLIDKSYTLAFTSSRTFRAKPFWTQAGAGPSLIMNVPQTYPAQPLNGMLVSGFVALDLKRAVHPPEELDWLEELGYSVDADMSLVEKGKSVFVEELRRVMDVRCQALHHHWDRQPWQNIMFVLTGTDRLNHYLWEDYEDPSSRHHQAFLDYYNLVDQHIGRIVERLPDDVTIAAVSDHGFARQQVSLNMNFLLSEGGYLQLNETARPSYIAMRPETKAFAMDPGRIYLHRESRYPGGQVTDDEAEPLMEELTRFFLEADVNGQRIASAVHRGTDIYSGPFAHRAPDLVVMPAENIALSGRMNLSELIEPTLINGKHTYEESSFFVRGSGLGEIPDDMKVEHVLDVILPRCAVTSERLAA